jgi:hypothetical protein
MISPMDKLTIYHIRVNGHLDAMWTEWFEGLTITNLEGGEALLSGNLPDQSALQGIFKRISDLGLTLISVNAVSEEK